jgi:hypothetical protein
LDKIVGYVAMGFILAIVGFLVVTNRQLTPQNAVFVRIALSLAAATWGGTLPGMLQVDYLKKMRRGSKLAVRGVGAGAFFLITYFATPKVFEQQLPVKFDHSELPIKQVTTTLPVLSADPGDQMRRAILEQDQRWKTWYQLFPLRHDMTLLAVRATFDRAYLPISATLVLKEGEESLNSTCALQPGFAALVERDDFINRQLEFAVLTDDGQGHGNPNNTNSLRIVDAGPANELLIVVSVVARDEKVKEHFQQLFQSGDEKLLKGLIHIVVDPPRT